MQINRLMLRKLIYCLLRPRLYIGLRHLVAPSIEHRDILRSVRPDFVIDVGANRGQFSLAVREALGDVEILAFEPLMVPAEILSKQKLLMKNLELFTIALGDEEGEVMLNVSKSDDSSSLLNITHSQVELYPGTEKISEEVVKIRRLDSYITHCAGKNCVLLKMDVQGYEKRVLEGAHKFLELVKFIYVELSLLELYESQPMASEVINFLYERGFMLRNVTNLQYAKSEFRLVQADFLFEKVA